MTAARLAPIAVALLLAGWAAVTTLVPGRGYWIVDPDASAYVGLARSLAAGDGYAFDGIPHAKFPPAFPGYLALAIRMTGDPEAYGAMRDLITAAGLVGLALLYAVSRRVLELGRGAALLLTLAGAASIFLIQYCSSFLRSEPLFFALFLAALLLGDGWRRHGGAWLAAGAGAAIAAATLTRSAGIVLLPALLAARFIDLRPLRLRGSTRAGAEALLLLAAALGPPVAFHVRNQALPPEQRSSGYLDELFAPYALDLTKNVDIGAEPIGLFSSAMAERVERNLAVLALSLGKFAVNDPKGANLAVDPHSPPDAPAMRPLGWLLLLLLGLGLWRAALHNQVAVVLATLAYVALYLVWPFNQQQRFYMPVQPLLLYLAALGAAPFVRHATALLAGPRGRWTLAIATLAAAAFLATGRSASERVVFGRYSAEFAALLGGAALLALALLAFAAWTRGRTLDAGGLTRRAQPAALALLALCWIAGAARFCAGAAREHAEFERARAAQPVVERFARIKAQPELIEVFTRLLERAGPDDLVMSDIPKMIHVTTGLHAVPTRVDTRTGEVILAGRDGRTPRFVYVSDEIPSIAAVFHRNAHLFEVIYSVRESQAGIPIRLYRVKADA